MLPSNRINIFSIQEHFLLRNNLYKLSNAFEDYAVIDKPAYKNFYSANPGRLMGGLATIMPKKCRKFVELVNCNSWRLQPFLLKLQKETIMVINTYFPTDSKSDENPDLVDVLAEMKGIIKTYNFDLLLILGDLNCDFM